MSLTAGASGTELKYEPEKTSRAHSRNGAIQGLRGLAAANVILCHCYNHLVEKGLMTPFASPFAVHLVHSLGGYSVCLFFCISGYLIVQSVISHGSVAVFAHNRIVRIYPVFGIIHLIIFTFGVAFGYEWLGQLKGHPLAYFEQFFSNLLFLPGVFTLPIAQANAWSLSYEALFYVIVCAAFAASVTRATNKLISWPLSVAFLAVAGTCLVMLPLSWYFLIGVLCYFLMSRNWSPPLAGWTAPIGLLCYVIGLSIFGYNPSYSLLFSLVAFATLVWQSGYLSEILRTPSLQYVGKISYSLYLTHPFVVHWIRIICVKLSNVLHLPIAVVFVPASLAASIFVAKYVYQWVEVDLTRRLFRKPERSRVSLVHP